MTSPLPCGEILLNAANCNTLLCQDADSLEPSCDIFISYRRKGGSDFAQLLKVCFKSMGLEVFLDVDNLGQVSALWCKVQTRVVQ